MLEQLYRRLSGEASAYRAQQGASAVTRETLPEHLATMFAHVVVLEDAIGADDEREITDALAVVAIDALAALNDLDAAWCLRAPRHEPGRYRAPSELTSDLRHRVQAVLHYWTTGHVRDTGVALELVVKSALELASRLDFDLGIAISARLRPSNPYRPQ